MPNVFSNDMVAHVWAQGRQESGRSHNGNFYFEGAALYSYGRHYVAGYRMPDGRVLVNAESRSATTSQHTSQAYYSAPRGAYRVPGLTSLADYLRRMGDSAWARKAVAKYVADNVLGMSGDAALYLLRVSGSRASLDALVTKAHKAAAKRKAAESKRTRKDRVAGGVNRLARLSEVDSAVARSTSVWDLTLEAKRVHRAAKAMAESNMPAKARTLRKLHKRIRARIKHLTATESVRRRRAMWAANVAILREESSYGQHATESSLRNVSSAAEYLAQYGGKRVNGDKLRTFAEELRSRAYTMRSEAAKRIESEWRAGATRYARFDCPDGGAALRADNVTRDDAGNINGGTLRTSHGAECPLVAAIMAFDYMRTCARLGQSWHANGQQIVVGHFRVDSISDKGTMKAGCHTIHLAEADRLAVTLGL